VLIEDSELYIGINTINQNQSIQFRTKNFSGDRFYITRSNKITLEEKKLINRNLIEKVILQKKMIDHQVFEESQEAVESTSYQMINSREGKGEFQLIELNNNVFLINPMKKLKLKDILEENDNYIYVYKGRIARMDEDFDKGSHRIMKVKRLKGGNGIGNLASDDDDSAIEEESEYLKAIRTKNSDELKEEFIKKLNEFHDLGREYGNDDEDDEDFSRFRDYYLTQIDVKLSEICRENGYDWNGEGFFKKEIDQELDKLITIARERAKFNRFNSNREFCRSYNSCKFMVCSDINETGKDFDKFKENLEALAEACEEGNLDWPFEKLYWEH
jgi:hypothetical protein